jgi:hypothetical protein
MQIGIATGVQVAADHAGYHVWLSCPRIGVPRAFEQCVQLPDFADHMGAEKLHPLVLFQVGAIEQP